MPSSQPAFGPPLAEVLDAARVVRVPLRVRFRGVLEREALLLPGPAGWGEFAPFPEYAPAEAARWLASALEAAWRGWPQPLRHEVEVNATVPAVAAEAVDGVLDGFPGCTTAKVKVAERGQSLADDLARVAAVRRRLGAGGRLRVDANGAWSVPEALEALAALAEYDLDYVEQPCASVPELAAVRAGLAVRGIRVRVAADESVRRAEDPLRVAREGAADLVVVKVAPLGGVRAALRIVRECGLPAVVSSALDTSVGLSAGLALAGALRNLDGPCGLGTAALLAGDVVAEPLLPVDGRLPVGPVDADPDLLKHWQAPPDRVAWWQQRVRDCWPHLPPATD